MQQVHPRQTALYIAVQSAHSDDQRQPLQHEMFNQQHRRLREAMSSLARSPAQLERGARERQPWSSNRATDIDHDLATERRRQPLQTSQAKPRSTTETSMNNNSDATTRYEGASKAMSSAP